jgi:large subunit ribosomal protein L22
MTAAKTNERPGTRAQAKNVRMSATKARVVLDLIRDKSVDEAVSVLAYTERRAAEVIGKCLDSAVANAEHNDQIDPETLFVSACYADEGRTLYRWRPRARGRATRIRKRTCHITIIVSPMSAQMLAREQAKREAIPGSRAARRRGQESAARAERVARSQQVAESAEDEEIVDQNAEAVAVAEETMAGVEAATTTDETGTDETGTDDVVAESDAEAADEADVVDTTAPIAEDTADLEADDTAEVADEPATEGESDEESK